MANRLSKGMMIVLLTNIINIAFSLITNFALPKLLSVETYAAIRTYQLYVSYIGILHLGYVDGVYLQYGGKNIDTLSRDDLGTQRKSFLLFQLVIAIVLGIPGCILRDTALIALCLTIVPFNVAQYYKFVYQATGEFSLYGQAINLTTVFIFVVNMLLLFVLHYQAEFGYLIGYVVSYYVIWGIMEVQFTRRVGRLPHTGISLKDLAVNIKNGWLLMLGNFTSVILTSIDRWFVKFLLETLAFAQYSFAVSMEGMLNVIVTPVSTTLYNYFCVEKDSNGIHRILNYVSLFAVAVVASAFPAKFIVERFLSNYLGSIDIMFFLFAGQLFFIIIKCVYVNLYKARQLQRLYFTKLVATIGIGIVLNIAFFLLWHYKESFALGTLVSAVIWFLLCQGDFPDQRLSIQQYVYLFLELILFLICGRECSAIWGFCYYVAGSLILTTLLMKKTFIEFLQLLWKFLIRKKV